MKREEVVFTALKTVRSNDFELLQMEFFNKMCQSIMSDSSRYKMEYNSDKDCYELLYNDKEYVIKCGDKIVNKNYEDQELVFYLERLVKFSELQNKIQNEENALKEARRIEYEKTLRRAKDGLLNSVAENEVLIKDLIKEDKRDGVQIFKESLEVLQKIVMGEQDLFCALRIVVGVIGLIFLIVASIAAFMGEAVPFWVFLLSGFPIVDTITFFITDHYDIEFRGYWASLAALISYPFITLFMTGRRLLEKILLSSKIRKIRKRISRIKSGNNMNKVNNKRINVKEILEYTSEKQPKENAVLSIKEFDDLKNYILSIKDNKTKHELSNDLYRLINDFIKIGSIGKKEKYYNIARARLESIKARVDIKLNEEKAQEKNEATCYKLMNEVREKRDEVKEEVEVAKQKTYGIRG